MTQVYCLKIGFVFADKDGGTFVTDLFYCKGCHNFATNSIKEIAPVEGRANHRHYADGKFTEEFVESRKEYYPELTPLDFLTR